MKNHRIFKSMGFVLIVCLLTVLFAGCASASQEATDNYFAVTEDAVVSSPEYAVKEEMFDSAADVGDAEYGSTGTGSGSSISVPDDGRKVILTAEVRMEAKEYDIALEQLLGSVSGMGGYVSNREDHDYGSRETILTLRIPSGRFDEFINGLPGIANITRLVQSSQDITESYIQTESYLASLTTQQDRLLELMAQAETLEDLLSIEDRLATVRAELQYYASLKNSYDNRISYSTITLTLWEVRDYTVIEPTFGEELWEVIRDTGVGFVEFLRDLLFFLISAFPYLILLTVVLIPTVKLLRRRRAKKAAKAAAAQQAAASEPTGE